MTVTLVIPESMAQELTEVTAKEYESAGVLLARHVETPRGNVRLLARAMHWIPEDAYLARDSTSMSIASHGYVPALSAAENEQAVPIWLHTHPGSDSTPRPSERDEIVDSELADLFRLRAGSHLYGAVVLALTEGRLSFAGHVESADGRSELDRIWVTGRRLKLIRNWLQATVSLSEDFDRNIRAFGGEIQGVLGDLRVAVVGCGGTGSAVVEQLVRLGVRHLDLFDPDNLTASNVTRVYGSFPEDVGMPKVDVSATHVTRIAPNARVTAEHFAITREAVARLLLDADIVFGCSDDNAGRLVLSRFASFLLTPVIDCGVLLSSGRDGQLEGIDGRVTVLAPGAACLVCRNRIDLHRAAAEMLSPDEYRRRADEGYAPGLAEIDPAVVAFTTQVAAAAVSELLERLIHYGPDPSPTEILLRTHEREVSTNDQNPIDGHYCDHRSGKLGIGVTTPFLEQTWHA